MAKKTTPSPKKGNVKQPPNPSSKKTKEKNPAGPKVIEELKIEEYQAITVDLTISDTELVQKSQEMIGMIKVRDQLKEDLKAYQAEKKGEITSIEKKIKDLEVIISTGKKKTPVQAGKIRNFMTTEVLLVRVGCDPNNLKPEDIYRKEPFTEFDYQLKIDMESGGDGNLKADSGIFDGIAELSAAKTEEVEQEETTD